MLRKHPKRLRIKPGPAKWRDLDEIFSFSRTWLDLEPFETSQALQKSLGDLLARGTDGTFLLLGSFWMLFGDPLEEPEKTSVI